MSADGLDGRHQHKDADGRAEPACGDHGEGDS